MGQNQQIGREWQRNSVPLRRPHHAEAEVEVDGLQRLKNNIVNLEDRVSRLKFVVREVAYVVSSLK